MLWRTCTSLLRRQAACTFWRSLIRIWSGVIYRLVSKINLFITLTIGFIMFQTTLIVEQQVFFKFNVDCIVVPLTGLKVDDHYNRLSINQYRKFLNKNSRATNITVWFVASSYLQLDCNSCDETKRRQINSLDLMIWKENLFEPSLYGRSGKAIYFETCRTLTVVVRTY